MQRYIWLVCAAVLVFTVTMSASAMASARLVQQVLQPNGVGLALTGIDVAEEGSLLDYGVRLNMITPNFKGTVSSGGSNSTILTVENNKVAQVLTGQGISPNVPPVPINGYVLIGSGIGASFLQAFQVGNAVQITSKEHFTLDPTPEKVIVGGAAQPVTSINKARGTNEVVIYTPDFGTHTFTNAFGMEAAVVDGRVVAIRDYQDASMFQIPENGYVISVHGNPRAWFRANIAVGKTVTFAAEPVKTQATVLPSELQKGGYVQFPIVNTTFKHEEAQFGYQPWYIRNEVSFDRYNRPYIRSRTTDLDETGFIQTMRSGRWVQLDFTTAIRATYPNFTSYVRGGGWNGAQVVFDAADDLYTIVEIKLSDNTLHNILLYSTDYGNTFNVYKLPSGTITLEHWVGHNSMTRPPLMGVFTFRAEHPATYGAYYNFSVLQPVKQNGKLIFPNPVLVSNNSLPPSLHSGGASFAVSSDEKAFVTWAEARDVKENVAGAPTYVATYDLKSNQIIDKQLITYAPPANDSHNTPGIVIDGKGYLHVITGAHGANFYYAKSLAPYNTGNGWTKPVAVLQTGAKGSSNGSQERGRQTYLAFLADKDDTLHIAFRQWREGIDSYFNGSLYGALSYQQKTVDQPWSEPKMLVVPPVPTYSIFYHKLSLDRQGRLYLSYNFRSNVGSYNFETPVYQYPAVIMSWDKGQSWKLVTSQDFANGIQTDAPDAGGEPGRIAAKIVSESGSPVPGAVVQAGIARVVADQDGKFVLNDLYVDKLTLSVRKEGFRTWNQDVTLPQHSPLQIEVVLTSIEEAKADWNLLWANALKMNVSMTQSGDGWRLVFNNKMSGASGVTFDVNPDEGYWALCFEGRSIQPASQDVNVTAIHTDGVERKTFKFTAAWQQYEIEAPSFLKRFNLMRSGESGTVEIRNVKFVRKQR